MSRDVRVAALRVGGEPAKWRDLGFHVGDDSSVMLGSVRIEVDPGAESGRITGWALEAENAPSGIDGLETTSSARSQPGRAHPNGALGIDHLVVLTPSLERTTAAFAEVGVERRRVREAGGGARQGFFLVGDLLVEVVDSGGETAPGPARFWGLTVEVADIDRAAELLGDRLGEVKNAVQPGRRIATVRSEASGGLPLALITQRKPGSH